MTMRQATRKECCGKNDLDRANRRERTEVRHLLGAVMKTKKGAGTKGRRFWTWWHC